MPFIPVETIGKKSNTAPLRYRMQKEKETTRIYINIGKEILSEYVGAGCRGFRLELDTTIGRGLLRVMPNADDPATRTGGKPKPGKTLRVSWAVGPDVAKWFRFSDGYQTLVHETSSTGVFFDLPAAAKEDAEKPKTKAKP